MEYMWAPWRMEYIKQAAGLKEEGCILCDHPARKDDEKNLIVYHAKYNYVIMNRYPYNAGHLMVAPERHCNTLDGLTDVERNEHFKIVSRCVSILRETFHCDGFNVGLNLGRGPDPPGSGSCVRRMRRPGTRAVVMRPTE